MTPTSPSGKSPLSAQGQKIALAVANIVYDDQAVQMMKQALDNTKSKEAITPQVAMAATTILHKLQGELDKLPDEEVWGKGGIVHLCLDSLFEVAKVMGYKAPLSELKKAYEMTEHMLEQGEQESPQEDAQEGGEEMQPPQQGAPQGPPQGAPMMQQAAMMGGM